MRADIELVPCMGRVLAGVPRPVCWGYSARRPLALRTWLQSQDVHFSVGSRKAAHGCLRTAAAGGRPNVQTPGGSLWPRTHERPSGSRTLLRAGVGLVRCVWLGAGELARHSVALACLAYTRSAHSVLNASSRDCSGPLIRAFTVSRGITPAAAPCLSSVLPVSACAQRWSACTPTQTQLQSRLSAHIPLLCLRPACCLVGPLPRGPWVCALGVQALRPQPPPAAWIYNH